MQHYEGCLDLASYFTNGGFSHDDLYDPMTDVLVVYSVDSRQFRITVDDADCLHESAQVAKRVRDAITASMQHAEPDFQSALLTEAKPVPQLPCDPGFGSPEPSANCPDPKPQTGWVTVARGQLTLSLFTTLHNDAEGQAYAEEHGEEFPFSNGYFDAPIGTSRALTLSQDTICTGVILVGYREPLEDHVVPCDQLTAVARRRQQVPVAVWSTDSTFAQVSELYRP